MSLQFWDAFSLPWTSIAGRSTTSIAKSATSGYTSSQRFDILSSQSMVYCSSPYRPCTGFGSVVLIGRNKQTTRRPLKGGMFRRWVYRLRITLEVRLTHSMFLWRCMNTLEPPVYPWLKALQKDALYHKNVTSVLAADLGLRSGSLQWDCPRLFQVSALQWWYSYTSGCVPILGKRIIHVCMFFFVFFFFDWRNLQLIMSPYRTLHLHALFHRLNLNASDTVTRIVHTSMCCWILPNCVQTMVFHVDSISVHEWNEEDFVYNNGLTMASLLYPHHFYILNSIFVFPTDHPCNDTSINWTVLLPTQWATWNDSQLAYFSWLISIHHL